MNNKQLRIAVAKDVIKQLDGLYTASTGIFCDITFGKGYNGKDADKTGLQAVLPNAKECRCCAVGSVFLSLIRLADDFKMNLGHLNSATKNELVWRPENDSMQSRLKQVFAYGQLNLMESAFETGGWTADLLGDPVKDTLEERAKRFGIRFPKATDRLRAIMKNVVANEGRFIPPKAKSKKAKKSRAKRKKQ